MQELWTLHQCAVVGVLLLLFAGQRASSLGGALLKHRKQNENETGIQVEVCSSVDDRTELQVLQNAHLRHDAATFRRVSDTQARNLVGRDLVDWPPLKDYLAGDAAGQAEDRAQEGRFAGAVGTEDRDDLTFVKPHVETKQNNNTAITDVQLPQFEQGLRR